jgi:hypothetical protein
MQKKKFFIVLSIITVISLVGISAQCLGPKEAPTIVLEVYDGPDYSESDNIYYYRVEAIATGTPDPEVKFSEDDNVSLIGTNRVEVGVDIGDSYDLTATAENLAGTASVTITLDGPFGEEVAEGEEITEEEAGAGTEEEEAEEEEAGDEAGEEVAEEEEEGEVAGEDRETVEEAELLINEADIYPNENLSGTLYATGHVQSASEHFMRIFVGDTDSAIQARGFLSFNISELHGKEVQNAEIHFINLIKGGTPESFASYMVVKACNYGTVLDADDFPPDGTSLARIPLSSTSHVISSDTLITELQEVLDSSRSYFQVRLSLNETTNGDGISDGFYFDINDVLLQINYFD